MLTTTFTWPAWLESELSDMPAVYGPMSRHEAASRMLTFIDSREHEFETAEDEAAARATMAGELNRNCRVAA